MLTYVLYLQGGAVLRQGPRGGPREAAVLMLTYLVLYLQGGAVLWQGPRGGPREAAVLAQASSDSQA